MIRPLSFNAAVDLSAVVPVFDEEGSLRELRRRVTSLVEALELTCEVMLVDDGSRDRTSPIIADLCADDARGIIGEYIGRRYDEVNQRPLFGVRERQSFRAPLASGRETEQIACTGMAAAE